MELLLNRDVRSVHSTTGKISVDGVFECFVLEDTDRGLKCTMPLQELLEKKLHGLTAIPEGRYMVVVNYSNRFKRNLPLLLNVPAFEGIRIHPGNCAADTEGCLLPGVARRTDWVSNSRQAFEALFQKISTAINRQEKVYITIQ